MKSIGFIIIIISYLLSANSFYNNVFKNSIFLNRNNYFDYDTCLLLSKSNDDNLNRIFQDDTTSNKLISSKKQTNTSKSNETAFINKNNKSIVMQNWRIFNVDVLLSNDPGKDDISIHDSLLLSIAKTIKLIKDLNCTTLDKTYEAILVNHTKVIRKSFDGRIRRANEPKFVYTVDLELPDRIVKELKLKHVDGKTELMKYEKNSKIFRENLKDKSVIIVGAGPSGLFAALELSFAGYKPIIIERGQPVEIRGRDIGALFNRKILNPESNLCYGEGGAGTWSDGKLTTRIGKNSDEVRQILHTLVDHGAPERILVDGKPHLGTDRLVRILKSIREYLIEKGVIFRFNHQVVDIIKDNINDKVKGVILSDNSEVYADCVVLAVGHSSRKLYEMLISKGVHVESKPIAVGFRIEHPQEVINQIQYGEFGSLCNRGKGPVPVADYRLATDVLLEETMEQRSCFSFCMCPGGQIVPTSVNTEELCVNGMSFSQRQSQFANSALVVNVNPTDMVEIGGTSPYRGVLWQKHFEKKAATLGGGNLVAPVQRATDFLEGKIGTSSAEIKSSYRMGVKEGPCHTIFPSFITETIRSALINFDRSMPGFLSENAILHGVETRTSAPIQITRSKQTLESISLKGLYPTGEGAGYAGGIISAAVDGIHVARAIIEYS